MSAANQTSAPTSPLGTAAATRLVAEREVSTQVKSKSFIISTLVTVVIIVGGIIALDFFTGNDDDQFTAATVDVVTEGQAHLETAGFDVSDTSSIQEAEELLREGEVDVIVTADPDSPLGLQLIGLDSIPMEEAQLLSVMPTMDVLDGDAADEGLRYIAAMGFGLVFMIVAMGSGMMILQNTIMEKQNRIVEILLSAISARALLAGKIVGNSIVALGQAVVMAASAALGLAVTGQLDYLEMLSWPMLWFVVFFIPGFVLVASVFAASASLVSRQEDSGSVMTPAMMMVMLPYFVVIFMLNNDLVITIASYVPFSAPVAMSLRLFDGDVAWFEPVVSMGILLLTTALVMALAAKIYSRSLLQMGQRVRLSAALKSSG
ncbi:ABC transporter permease [Nesterenkonia muleiensis]|uniref:ABC transporter permease n=1 Tax=Nesterenkonia muleiensis TaxID=2282648 RepID=UPI000E7152F8|nr:ABC transporter permease [Nesterenkonia muleiensis]